MMSGFITFRSVTFAQRGEAALQQAGIRCAVQRTPRWMEEQGCGYCLRIRQADGKEAVQRLREQQIAFRKVYMRREDGAVEAVSL